MHRDLISIVVPVFNEELNLRRFYDEMISATSDADYNIEFIFVNDGSRDRSLEVLKELHENDQRVAVLNLSRNFGSYAAIEAGLTHARGNAMMCISADLQDPPSIIQKFVPLWRSGQDIVWGVRAGRDDPFMKSLYARLFYGFVRVAAFRDFPKDGMDIGLFDRRVIRHYLKIGDRNSIPFFTIFSLGYRQAQVPYRRVERTAGESGWPFWKRVKCAVDIAVQFSYLPIRIIMATGLLSLLVSLVLVIISALNKDTAGTATIVSTVVLFAGGIQMISTAIVAEYLWRSNDKLKNRPAYLVMDCYDKNSNQRSPGIDSPGHSASSPH